MPIDRVFIQIGSFEIYWYSIMIVSGIIIGIYLAEKESERIGIHKEIISTFAIVATVSSIMCARIYYVILEWDQYYEMPWKIFAFREGGLAIHGAIIGGILTGVIYSKIMNIPFWRLADIIAPSLILGQAIGRWGNFFNQEAHGGPVSDMAYNVFIQYLPDFILNQMTINNVLYHPTFLYESIWNIIIFIILIILRKYNPLCGEIFLSYAILYSVGRFFIESMRTDSLYLFADIKMAQLISVISIILALILIIYRRIKGNKTKYNNFVETNNN